MIDELSSELRILIVTSKELWQFSWWMVKRGLSVVLIGGVDGGVDKLIGGEVGLTICGLVRL